MEPWSILISLLLSYENKWSFISHSTSSRPCIMVLTAQSTITGDVVDRGVTITAGFGFGLTFFAGWNDGAKKCKPFGF